MSKGEKSALDRVLENADAELARIAAEAQEADDDAASELGEFEAAQAPQPQELPFWAPPLDPGLDALVRIAEGEASCGSCVFFAAAERECRKAPPPRGSGQQWPTVAANAWCGEFLAADIFLTGT